MKNTQMQLSLPKMIIFDYGHTLIYEPSFDSVRGTKAIMDHATRNAGNLSVSEVASFSDRLFEDIIKNTRDRNIEIHNMMYQRLLYEYLDIETSLSKEEMEEIYWDNASPGFPMPNIGKLLSYLYNRGIRSGIISNISFSEHALTERINRLLPENHFEFIIASSEYIYRKPNKLLFELALKKAHLKPDEVWYCGDNTQVDCKGASNAGIFPVWFQSSLSCHYRDKSMDVPPECRHLHIHDWDEMINILQKL